MYMLIFISFCANVYINVYIRIHMYIHICIHTHVYIYIYIYIYIQINRQTDRQTDRGTTVPRIPAVEHLITSKSEYLRQCSWAYMPMYTHTHTHTHTHVLTHILSLSHTHFLQRQSGVDTRRRSEILCVNILCMDTKSHIHIYTNIPTHTFTFTHTYTARDANVGSGQEENISNIVRK